MKKLLTNSVILISLILFGFTSFAYNYTVYGYISDGNENPMSQVEVTIFEMNSSQDSTSANYVTVYTSPAGYYEGTISIENDDTATTLFINVTSYCYGTIETQIEIITVQEEGQQQINFEICSNPENECFLGFFYYCPNSYNSLEVNFMSYSYMSGSNDSTYITNYEWDFGDGTTSTENNPVHIYNEEGTYTVVITASSEVCGELTFADLVYVSGSDVFDCYADFYYYFSYGDSSDFNIPTNYNIIDFVDASYAVTDITSWTWEFGDGTTSTEQNPTHEYTEDGEYLVSLTIETDDCSSTTEYYVWIEDNSWYPEECIAIFWVEYNQEDYFTIQFNDFSWGNGNEILAWNWNFGDGAESTEQNPSHTYTEEGAYPVSLTIYTDSCTSTFVEVVYVEEWGNPAGGYCGALFIPEFIENSLFVQFYDLSIPVPETWDWDFGDGSTSTEQNPLHEYADTGIYMVSLTTLNVYNDSCIGSFEMEIYVHQSDGHIVKSYATGPGETTDVPNTTSKIAPNISLYPNPVYDKLFVVIPNDIENAQVEIMNIAGQIIISQNYTNNKFYVNTTELSQGLYIASIIIDGKRTNFKFFK